MGWGGFDNSLLIIVRLTHLSCRGGVCGMSCAMCEGEVCVFSVEVGVWELCNVWRWDV